MKSIYTRFGIVIFFRDTPGISLISVLNFKFNDIKPNQNHVRSGANDLWTYTCRKAVALASARGLCEYKTPLH